MKEVHHWGFSKRSCIFYYPHFGDVTFCLKIFHDKVLVKCKTSVYMSWWISTFNEVNDWAPERSIAFRKFAPKIAFLYCAKNQNYAIEYYIWKHYYYTNLHYTHNEIWLMHWGILKMNIWLNILRDFYIYISSYLCNVFNE